MSPHDSTGCRWCGVGGDDECTDDCPTRYAGELGPARCWWCESKFPHVWHDNGTPNVGGRVDRR